MLNFLFDLFTSRSHPRQVTRVWHAPSTYRRALIRGLFFSQNSATRCRTSARRPPQARARTTAAEVSGTYNDKAAMCSRSPNVRILDLNQRNLSPLEQTEAAAVGAPLIWRCPNPLLGNDYPLASFSDLNCNDCPQCQRRKSTEKAPRSVCASRMKRSISRSARSFYGWLRNGND